MRANFAAKFWPAKLGHRKSIVESLMFFFLAASSLLAAASDWPMAGRDPQRSNCSPGQIVGPFTYRWTRHYDEKVAFAQLIVVGDRGYFATLHGSVFRIFLDDGDVDWQAKIGGAVLGSVAADRDRVYAASSDGCLYALDSKTGEQAWTFQGNAGSVAHVLLVDNKVIYTDMAGYCYAVDAATGHPAWSFNAGTMILDSPASDGERVFFASEEIRAYALDLASGKQLWSAQMRGDSIKEHWPAVSLKAGVVHFSPKAYNAPMGSWKFIHSREFPKTEQEHASLQDEIVGLFSKYPAAKCHFFFKTRTGEEAYEAPILFNFGRYATPAPPAVDPNGNWAPSSFFYAPPKPQDSAQYGCAYVATIDALTGRLIPPPFLIGVSGWDEYVSVALAGRTVFRDHWGNVAVKDMDTPPGKDMWFLHMPGHAHGMSRPGGTFHALMGLTMQSGAACMSFSGNRVYNIGSSWVCCAEGTLKGEK